MNKRKVYTLFIIAVVFSFSSFCVSLIRVEPITWDSLEGLAGILSILVTLLLGWQIFYVIDIERKMKSIVNKELAKTKDEVANVLYRSIISNSLEENIESIKYYITNREWSRVASIYSSILGDYIKLEDITNIEGTIDNIDQLYDMHSKDIKPFQTFSLMKTLKKAMVVSDKAYDLIRKLEIKH